MSEHDDLEILSGLALALGNDQPEQPPNHQVYEREKLGNPVSAPFTRIGK